MTLAHVVQHVLHALHDALALGVYGFLLGISVEGQKVARRGSCHPLLNREADTRTCFFVCVHHVAHAQQGARIQQVHGGIESSHRVVLPSLTGEASVFEYRIGLQALLPQLLHFLGVIRL